MRRIELPSLCLASTKRTRENEKTLINQPPIPFPSLFFPPKVKNFSLQCDLTCSTSKLGDVAIESDGSVPLNLGAMITLANERPPNLTVIVFDNQCYMATGGLPTATAGVTDLAAMANGAGIENSYSVSALNEFEREARAALQCKGPNLTSSARWKRQANE